MDRLPNGDYLLTTAQQRLLLFLEDCALNNGGVVDSRRMNNEDMVTAQSWDDEGFIYFGRLLMKDIQALSDWPSTMSHYVVFTDSALTEAAKRRRERICRSVRPLVLERLEHRKIENPYAHVTPFVSFKKGDCCMYKPDAGRKKRAVVEEDVWSNQRIAKVRVPNKDDPSGTTVISVHVERLVLAK